VEGLLDERFPALRYERGRLNAEIMKRHGVTDSAACYVCGPGPMMEAALKELELLGVAPQTVAQERFVWKK
jgi:ferredoxin-NADP reductase